MDGKVLAQAFDREIELELIPSWETVEGDCGMHPEDLREDPIANQEALEQLVQLGYIEKPDENVQKAVEKNVSESKFYLARVHLNKNQYTVALPILEELYESHPDQIRYAFYLAQCYQSLNQLTDCRRVIDFIIAQQEHGFPQLDLMQGTLNLAEGNYDQALEFLNKAEQADPRMPTLHNQIGAVYLKINRFEEAERAFLKGLDIDPENAHTHCGLAETYFRTLQYEKAADYALNSVGLLYHNFSAHYWLGAALEKMDYLERAAEAFEVSLAIAPGFQEARRKLIALYEDRLCDSEKAQEHQRIFEEIGIRRHIQSVEKKTAPERKDTLQNTPSEAKKKPLSENVITVVSGLPRSGTSLMMQMLEKGGMEILTDGMRKADENNERGYYEYEKVKTLMRDHSWLKEAEGKAIKIVSPLLHYLPKVYNYRIIFMERDVDEIVLSQHKMLEKMSGKQSKNPDALKKTFQRQSDRIKAWLHQQENIHILFVNYCDIVSNPNDEAQRVNNFLSGKLAVSNMVSAVDPSLRHQIIEKN